MSLAEIILPAPAYDIVQKENGFVLFAGHRNSKAEATLEQLKKKWKEADKQVVSILRESYASEVYKNLTYENMNQSQNIGFLKKADVVILENIEFDHEIEKAIHLYEEGRVVVAHFSCPHLLSALHRTYALLDRTGGAHWRWRFVEGYSVKVLCRMSRMNQFGPMNLFWLPLK